MPVTIISVMFFNCSLIDSNFLNSFYSFSFHSEGLSFWYFYLFNHLFIPVCQIVIFILFISFFWVNFRTILFSCSNYSNFVQWVFFQILFCAFLVCTLIFLPEYFLTFWDQNSWFMLCVPCLHSGISHFLLQGSWQTWKKWFIFSLGTQVLYYLVLVANNHGHFSVQYLSSFFWAKNVRWNPCSRCGYCCFLGEKIR